MTSSFELKVLLPSRSLPPVKAKSLQLPGSLGYMTILPDHATMIAELKAGELVFEAVGAGAPERYFISGGYVEVDHDRVTVLADQVEKAGAINVQAAEADLQTAQEAAKAAQNGHEVEEANQELNAAEWRLQIARGAPKA